MLSAVYAACWVHGVMRQVGELDSGVGKILTINTYGIEITME